MSIIYIALPITVGIVIAAIAGFIWAVRGGQFDDLHSPAIRMLHDDEPQR